jgi:hypothetical protein
MSHSVNTGWYPRTDAFLDNVAEIPLGPSWEQQQPVAILFFPRNISANYPQGLLDLTRLIVKMAMPVSAKDAVWIAVQDIQFLKIKTAFLKVKLVEL